MQRLHFFQPMMAGHDIGSMVNHYDDGDDEQTNYHHVCLTMWCGTIYINHILMVITRVSSHRVLRYTCHAQESAQQISKRFLVQPGNPAGQGTEESVALQWYPSRTFRAGTCFQNKKPVGLPCDRLVICALLVGHMLGCSYPQCLLVYLHWHFGVWRSPTPFDWPWPWLGNIPSTMTASVDICSTIDSWPLAVGDQATGLSSWRQAPWSHTTTESSAPTAKNFNYGVHSTTVIFLW